MPRRVLAVWPPRRESAVQFISRRARQSCALYSAGGIGVAMTVGLPAVSSVLPLHAVSVAGKARPDEHSGVGAGAHGSPWGRSEGTVCTERLERIAWCAHHAVVVQQAARLEACRFGVCGAGREPVGPWGSMGEGFPVDICLEQIFTDRRSYSAVSHPMCSAHQILWYLSEFTVSSRPYGLLSRAERSTRAGMKRTLPVSNATLP